MCDLLCENPALGHILTIVINSSSTVQVAFGTCSTAIFNTAVIENTANSDPPPNIKHHHSRAH